MSLWRRFKDADESAYYEFICRESGINVHYCAEQFENDGSIGSTIIKSVKRAIIEPDFFEAAQRIVHDRTKRFTDEELLNRLRALFAEKGWLSGLIIDETEDMPSSSVIRRRFGSLVRAYRLVGYAPDRDLRYIETNRALRNLHPEVISEVVSAAQECGATIDRNPLNDLLRINGEFSASVVIVRCQETPAGAMRWKVRLDTGLRPDITIVVRMAAGNQLARDYYLLPCLDLGSACSVKLAPDNAA